MMHDAASSSVCVAPQTLAESYDEIVAVIKRLQKLQPSDFAHSAVPCVGRASTVPQLEIKPALGVSRDRARVPHSPHQLETNPNPLETDHTREPHQLELMAA
jgi:hypothetical protein